MILGEDTCWRREPAERVAFLIDGHAYFHHLVDALERARRSILIVGWDIHSQVPLRRGEGVEVDRYRLGPLLDRLAARRRQLQVHLLMWDYSLLYATERELMQRLRLGWRSHRRVHFQLDGNHPLGASHHQKIVVVDDQVAFVGGLDLTMRRWDTPEHEPDAPGRHDPAGKAYGPFHDVQMAVSGPVARAVGDLVRERWHRATGRRLQPVSRDAGDPWPPELEPELEDVEVAVCRTEPRHDGRDEVREIQRLYQRAIAAAHRTVFLENQYATSKAIADALGESLRQEQGPEILLIQPRRISGWLELATIGNLRASFLARMAEADSRGRFLSCYPHRASLDEDAIKVHSKVCLVDDRFVTVGSANLANRSMGLDTECNLAIETDDPEQRRALARFRDRLLAEHLGAEPERVGRALEEGGSLLDTVRSLGSEQRGLRPIRQEEPEAGWVREVVPDEQLLDPEQPLAAGDLLRELGARTTAEQERQTGRWVLPVAVLAAALLLALAWRATPLSDWLTSEQVGRWVSAYRDSAAAFPLTLGLFVVAGLVFFPVTLLLVQTAAVFGPVTGFALGLAGSLASAAVLFGCGRLLGGKTLRRLAGGRLSRVLRFLERRGVLSVAAIRLAPVAPYSLVNLGAGAAGVRWVPFLLGTLLGMAPGTAALSFLGDRAAAAIRNPSWQAVLMVLLAAAALFGVARWVAARSAAWAESDRKETG